MASHAAVARDHCVAYASPALRREFMAPKDRHDHHRSHSHSHDGPTIQSERGPYAAFVDELFCLGQIDAEKRDFLHRGLTTASGAPVPSITRPSSAGIKYSDGALKRAAAAGLVRRVDGGRTIIGCGPETVHWGYLWGAAEPIAVVPAGAEVTIDTVSH